jgi:hypothetical protein
MNLLLAGLTAAVVAGAVVAVSTRETRESLLGLLVTLLAASLLADPLPGPLPFAARIAAALLAARLIAISIRGLDRPTAGSRLGWPVEALAAAAAGVIGYGTHGLGAPAAGPAAASAAGFAVGILAAAPIVTSRDVYRLGTGAMLLLVGGLLVRVGLGGTPSDLEQLVTCGLIAGVGGAVAVIVRGARDATGELSLVDDHGAPRPPSRHLGRRGDGIGQAGPAAHPASEPAAPAMRSGAAPDASPGR